MFIHQVVANEAYPTVSIQKAMKANWVNAARGTECGNPSTVL